MISLEKARSYIVTSSLIIVGIGVLAWFYITSEGGDNLKGTHEGSLQVIDFKTLVTKGDDYLVCAKDACLESSVSTTSKVYDLSRSDLSQAFFNYTDNSVQIRSYRRDLSSWQFDFTERVSSEKFPHVITVQFIALSPTTSSFNIYSRSELKSSEQKIHRERVERWIRFMESSVFK